MDGPFIKYDTSMLIILEPTWAAVVSRAPMCSPDC